MVRKSVPGYADMPETESRILQKQVSDTDLIPISTIFILPILP